MQDDQKTRQAASLARAQASKQIEQRGDSTRQTATNQTELGETDPSQTTPNADPRFVNAQEAEQANDEAEFGTTNPGV